MVSMERSSIFGLSEETTIRLEEFDVELLRVEKNHLGIGRACLLAHSMLRGVSSIRVSLGRPLDWLSLGLTCFWAIVY